LIRPADRNRDDFTRRATRPDPGIGTMSDPNSWDEGDVGQPTPWYRRRNVLLAGVAGVALCAFLFTRGMGEHAAATDNAKASPISVVVPYQPPPAPPQAPKIKTMIPAAANIPHFPAPVRHAAGLPISVTYVVKQDPPKPAAPRAAADPQTKLAFAAGTIPGTKASPAYDETYMLDPGLLPCVLDVAIDSSLPGPLMCHLPGPVYSSKGVLLMPAGTQIIGQYRTMQNNGADRLMAVSTFAHTPDGVWVPLTGEPLADGLGRSGLDGNIDNHILQRFGGAVLLDLAQSSLGIVQAKVAKGGNTYISTNSSDNLASQILQATINIPPTFSRPQGGLIALWITQPIDFSGSYRVRPVSAEAAQ
jgi:type IV secretory pathway VirB10-like protein